ncbi:TcpQ domain-containing protein [Caballeronia sp. LP003]|uniref:TcpQ domain-containing protein n=1 Tax=Caballeronia sp. LP003 TaxID=3038551 RepID=UPI002862A58C|nr:TcpQ domain-containing protein [Caballeronia sp. LP003]MDR5791741.1 TcpQ domain-containing protein [Caballeronia sp. LP003]
MRLPLALMALASFAPLAHASYYVVDNPPPAPVSALIRSMPQAQPSQLERQSVTVPFARRSSQLSRDAIRALSGLLDSAQDASQISIGACGDGDGDSDSIAYRRAANVKAWLLDNGISGHVVTTAADGAVMKTAKGFACVVKLTVGSPAPGAASAYADLQRRDANAVQNQPAAASATPVAAPLQASAMSIARNEQMKMISRVLDMANSKIISADNAVAMIAQLMKETEPAATVAKPAVAAIAPAPVTAQITALPLQNYALTTNRTLKDTLSDWARSAGWREPTWSASNPYLVAQGQNMSGDFMGALRSVSDLVPGLDFRVNTATREITVMDAVH